MPRPAKPAATKAAPAAKKAPAKPAANPRPKVVAKPVRANPLDDPKVQDGLKHLAKIAEERAAFENLEATQQATVEALRKAGATWKSIGEALNMSGVWLQRKYRTL